MSTIGGASTELRIISAKRTIRQHVHDIISFRELLATLVQKELKVRYKNSSIGFVWSMIQPLFLLAIYGIAFSILGQGFRAFPVWLMSGLVVWTFVNTALTTSTESITANAILVGKVNFPRAVLPLATLGSAFVHFCLQLGTLTAVLIVVQHHIDVAYVWLLPLAVLALGLFLAAMALILSVANVYARDTQHLLNLALVAFFWGNPIIYEYIRLQGWLSNHHLPTWLPLTNPVTSVVIIFQRALYGTDHVPGRNLLPPDGPLWYLRNIAIIAVVSIALLAVALRFFDRHEGNLAETL